MHGIVIICEGGLTEKSLVQSTTEKWEICRFFTLQYGRLAKICQRHGITMHQDNGPFKDFQKIMWDLRIQLCIKQIDNGILQKKVYKPCQRISKSNNTIAEELWMESCRLSKNLYYYMTDLNEECLALSLVCLDRSKESLKKGKSEAVCTSASFFERTRLFWGL